MTFYQAYSKDGKFAGFIQSKSYKELKHKVKNEPIDGYKPDGKIFRGSSKHGKPLK